MGILAWAKNDVPIPELCRDPFHNRQLTEINQLNIRLNSQDICYFPILEYTQLQVTGESRFRG